MNRRYLNLLSFRTVKGPIFKLAYWPGDDWWRASIHLHWWFGGYRWHVLFLPW